MEKSKLNEIFPLVYYINLDEREDRRKETEWELEEYNIEAERFEAIKVDEPRMGCWLSHLRILEEAREKNQSVFIFEDDTVILENKRFKIDYSVEELEKLDWDMFYLGGNILRPFFQVTDYLARLSHCQSTHAYGINIHMIDPIIKTLERFISSNLHIDQVYADYIVPNVRAYISHPMLAIQRESYSDILGKVENYGLPTKRYWHYLITKEST